MQVADIRLKEQTAIRTDLGAIFVSIELSRSVWLITSLSPGAGEKMSKQLKAQISRELDRLEVLLEQLKTVEAERDALLVPAENDAAGVPAHAAMLMALKGVGPEFATVLWSEGLFRHFANRRQVAAYAGLAPTPWRSGSIDREQGISKAGNPRLRTTASTRISTLPLVSCSSRAKWRASAQDSNHRTGTQALGRVLEICDHGSGDRRGCDESLTLKADILFPFVGM
jgi:transposase